MLLRCNCVGVCAILCFHLRFSLTQSMKRGQLTLHVRVLLHYVHILVKLLHACCMLPELRGCAWSSVRVALLNLLNTAIGRLSILVDRCVHAPSVCVCVCDCLCACAHASSVCLAVCLRVWFRSKWRRCSSVSSIPRGHTCITDRLKFVQCVDVRHLPHCSGFS